MALLPALLASGVVAAPVRLLMKPSQGHAIYQIETREQVQTRTAAEKTGFETRVRRKTRRRAVPTADGVLRVEIQVTEKQVALNDRWLKPLKYPANETAYLCRLDGARTGSGAREGLTFWPTFPARAIEPGHRWSQTVPPSDQFALPVKLKHTFKEERTIDGERCAILVTRADLDQVQASTGFRIKLKVEDTIAFGIESGEVVWSKTATSFTRADPRPPEGEPSSMRRLIVKQVRRSGREP